MVQPALQPSNPSAPNAGVPQPGEVLVGKYVVERVLGIGGMGVVLAAMHRHLNQRVAIKMLLPQVASQPEALARFTREAQASSSIRSEHVALVSDVGTLDNGLPFMVMEFLEGEDLNQLLHQRRWLPTVEAVDYVVQACEAVAHAHRLGIVHRDLKPSNLFLTHRLDGTPLIKVLDFGISKLTTPENSAALTATSFAFGTPFYMSPEQVRSAKYVDPRTDIWALGVILHELLCGRPPFEGESLTALCAAITADAPRPLRRDRPDAPAPLEAALLRALQKDPAVRFQSVLEFARAIAPFGSPPSAALVQSIDRIGVATLPKLARPSGPAVDPHGTFSSWETGRLPAAGSKRWVLIAVAATLSAGLLSAGAIRLLAPTPAAPASASSAAALAPSAPSAALASSAPTAEASAEPPAASATVVASSRPGAPGKAPPAKTQRPGTSKGQKDVQDDRR